MINVKDVPFGATGDGFTDDRAAIQAAINYAKSIPVPGNSAVTYRATVYFPAGYYYISGPINLTNSNGIWLIGDGGSYINTIIVGSTGGAIFDFSGSSLSGCENFCFTTSDRSNRSTIGVLFALTGNGGLNCGIRNCYFQMEDQPNANGGLGSVGLLNIRSEEFYIHDCLIRANIPLLFSYSVNLSIFNINYTISSFFQTLASGNGSMGVININGTSLHCYEKRQPAMILIGTNSLHFHGYLSRITSTVGTNETAILCTNYTTNLRIHATIESFSRILGVKNASLEGNEIDVVSANVTSPTTELVNLTGCTVKGLKLRITLPVLAERSNRYVVYHDPATDPNQRVSGTISNSEFTCYDINSNQYIISPSLLRNASNVVFNTYLPFEKKAGRMRLLSNKEVSIGTVGAPAAATIFQFQQADNTASPNGRGGYYRIWVDGVIRGGSYGSGGSAVLAFQAQLLVNQNYVGTLDLPSITVIILDKSVTNPAYIDVVGAVMIISFSNRIGSVSLTARCMGSGTGEPLTFSGMVELQSDFLVYDPIPIG